MRGCSWMSVQKPSLCNDTAWDLPPWLSAVHSSLYFGLHIFHFPHFLPQHTVPQSSAYKKFWRRCQGLLENTLGSLKRKKKIYQQSANEVNCVVWNSVACCISSMYWSCMLCAIVFGGMGVCELTHDWYGCLLLPFGVYTSAHKTKEYKESGSEKTTFTLTSCIWLLQQLHIHR